MLGAARSAVAHRQLGAAELAQVVEVAARGDPAHARLFGGFGDQSGANGLGTAAGQLGATLAANRVPLAFMFLTLEALLLASAAAYVWARNTPSNRVPDEVLSP